MSFKKLLYHCIPGTITSIDDIPMCEFIDPPLTTMQVPKHQLGYLAIKRLVINCGRAEHELVKIEVKTRLIKRESVADHK